jgi:hypothetical protein
MARCEENVLTATWSLGPGKALTLLANLSPAPAPLPRNIRVGGPIWGGEPSDPLPPWSVFWSIG